MDTRLRSAPTPRLPSDVSWHRCAPRRPPSGRPACAPPRFSAYFAAVRRFLALVVRIAIAGAILAPARVDFAAPPDVIAESLRLLDAGRDEPALALLDDEAIRATAAGDRSRLALLARHRADALRSLGRLERSREALAGAGDDEAASRSRGLTADAMGARLEAVEHFEKSAQAAREHADAPAEAEATWRTGAALLELDRPNRAITTLRRAIELASGASRSWLVARAFADLARAHALIGESAAALDAAESALAALAKDAPAEDEASVVATLVRLRVELGDVEGALALRPRLDGALGRGAPLRVKIRARLDLARAWLAAQRPVDALAAVDAATPDAETTQAPRTIAETLVLRSVALRALARGGDAEPLLERAAGLASGARDRRLLVAALVEQGRGRLARGDAPAARQSFGRAVREAEAVRDRRALVEALTLEASALLAQHRPDAALSSASRALSEAEPLVGGLGDQRGPLARAELSELLSIGAQAAVAVDDAAALFTMLERARAGALLEAVGGWRAIAWSMIPPDLREEEARAAGREARAQADVAAALDSGVLATMRSAQSALDAARADAVTVVDRIRRDAKREAGFCYPRPMTLEDAQARLAADEALVEYGRAGERLVALLLRRDAARIVDLGPAEPIVTRARETDWREPKSDGEDAVADLVRLIVKPLGLPDDVVRVSISPDGDLARVPFAQLLPGRRLVYAPSATVSELLREGADAGAKTIGFGDPALVRDGAVAIAGGARASRAGLRGRLLPLPGARDEVRAVADIRLLGSEATESAFRERAAGGGAHWRTVLLGCHGVADAKHPPFSMLVLTPDDANDGDLTAIEIAQLSLRADLVVLSACETAVGPATPAEGALTLARSFLVAGASRVIGALWRVDDAATHALVTAFFEAWRAGASADEALAKAQARVREEPKWAAPVYWAAWQLWGAR